MTLSVQQVLPFGISPPPPLLSGKRQCGLEYVSGAEAERGTKDDGALLLGRNVGSSLDHLCLLICVIELFLLLTLAAGLVQVLWRVQGL